MHDTTNPTPPKTPSKQLRDDLAEMTSLLEVTVDTVAAMRAVAARALAHHRALLAARDAEGR